MVYDIIIIIKYNIRSSAQENFHWNLYLGRLMANLLNVNYAYHYIFRNLSMIAYKIEIQKSNFANNIEF